MLHQEKQRQRLIDVIEKAFKRRLKNLQGELLKLVIQELESELSFDGDKIKSTNSNLLKMSRLNFIQQDFRKKKVNPLLSWVAKQYLKILRLNNKYFLEEVGDEAKKQRNTIEKFMLKRYGVSIRDEKLIIDKVGWLAKLGDFEEPYQKFRELAADAIQQGVTMKELRQGIKEYITPDKTLGGLERHFQTLTTDEFARFDRVTHNRYANKLGLRVFVYTGGLIDDSRDFCKVRNRQAFTIEEVLNFGTSADIYEGYTNKSKGEFNGKNENYSPLKDFGGHNCRHFPSWISKARATRLRPELKQYFEDLEN